MNTIPDEVCIAALETVLKPLGVSLRQSLRRDDAIEAMRGVLVAQIERDASLCEETAKAFLSPQYAFNQPLGSLTERFACDECAAAIRKGQA